MGVPKLFKYLTDRYPSLCQTIPASQVSFRQFSEHEQHIQYKFSAFQLPKYDYLYIDLNFLIHKATTDKGLLPLEEVDSKCYSEPRIFERILRYIETLHRIIPSKVLFLSIDGVAPRAKWATQRERRYCTFADHIYISLACFSFDYSDLPIDCMRSEKPPERRHHLIASAFRRAQHSCSIQKQFLLNLFRKK